MYQGRFKSFPIQEDQHLLTVLRYVERNALRAKLVASAEARRWCSLWHRLNGVAAGLVDEGPVPLSRNWRRQVQLPQRDVELAALRQSAVRGCAFGEASWQEETGKQLHLESTLLPRGRPRKARPAAAAKKI